MRSDIDGVLWGAVLTQQATKCFQDKKYDMAATFYAKTSMSFEEITLKFVSQDEPEALRMYLSNKLDNISEQDETQLTLLCTWLVEIYMDNINHADSDKRDAIVADFRMFLRDQKGHLDPTTTYNLLSSHGRMDELLFFAELLGDFERVITHHIQVCDYKRALETLQKNAEQTRQSDLYYKFSPALMAHVPYLTVKAWLEAMGIKDRYGNCLIEPRKLIPALMRYDPNNTKFSDQDEVAAEEVGSNQAVKFLLECIEDHGVEDQAVSNYLISVLAQQPSEESLLRFLNNVAQPNSYDVSYALRQCMAADKQQAVVYLYGELGLYEEAVERALGLNNLDLALANAERPGSVARGEVPVGGDEESEELRKRLWLRIARHVVTEKDDIRAAINLMSQSEGLLKIEDILPFFPGFARIDDFKDEICNALDGYNQHIKSLKEEMQQTTESSERIRRDMRELAERYAFVQPDDRCCLSGGPILAKKFAVFPCMVDGKQCMFYEDELAKEVKRVAGAATRQKIEELEQQIRAVRSRKPALPPFLAAVLTGCVCAGAGRARGG